VGGDPRAHPYLAPEQVAEHGAYKSADIYAIGALLFEMLTGKPPFGNESPADVSRRIRTARAPDVDEFAPDMPRHVVEATAKALAKHPSERWASAAEFAEALHVPTGVLQVGQTAPLPIVPERDKARESPAPEARTARREERPLPVETRAPREPVALPIAEPRGWEQFKAVTWAAARGHSGC
jgi:serine/threonine protein kinase